MRFIHLKRFSTGDVVSINVDKIHGITQNGGSANGTAIFTGSGRDDFFEVQESREDILKLISTFILRDRPKFDYEK